MATPAELSELLYDGLVLCAWLVTPALLAALAVGAVTSLIQAATQVQEPALSFVPKLFAVGAALVVSAAAMRDRWLAFAEALLAAFV